MDTRQTRKASGFRHYYFAVFLLGLVLFLLARTFAIPGETDSGSLLGTVTDQEDRPLPGIEVVLLSGQHEPRRTTSDVHGRFKFLSLDPGNYTIEAYGLVAQQGYGKGVYESVLIAKGRATTLQMQLRRALRILEDQPIQPEDAVPYTPIDPDRP